MKTFKDLKFNEHPNKIVGFSTQAEMKFDNGYGISVITGTSAYASYTQPYEIAVLKNGSLCYSTPITDDVIGYCDEKKVTEIMEEIQLLKD